MIDRHVGVTATRRGLMPVQLQRVSSFLPGYACLHHGDCLGGDKQIHDAARALGILIELHPPSNPKFRARCTADYVNEPKRYLARNRDIVDTIEALIAAPGEPTEQLRSGTWATVRYARQQGKPLVIVYPDGSVLLERFTTT